MFMPDGGHVLKFDGRTMAKIKEFMATCEVKTPFGRPGNTCMLDAYVRVPPGRKLEGQVARMRSSSKGDRGFQRQGTR